MTTIDLKGFRPRTHGSDFAAGLRAKHFPSCIHWGYDNNNARLMTGLAEGIDALITDQGNLNTAQTLVAGWNADRISDFETLTRHINAAWPSGHVFPTYDVDQRRAYQEAFSLLMGLEYRPALDLLGIRVVIGNIAAADRLWAWAQTGVAFPDAVTEANPVDTLQAFLMSTYSGDNETAVLGNKEYVALLGAERARTLLAVQGPVETPTTIESVEEESQVARLQRDLAEVKANHEADIRLMERVFWQEAYDRSWCSEAETVIRRLNRDLNISMSEDRDTFRPWNRYKALVYVDAYVTDDGGERWHVLNHNAYVEVVAHDYDDAKEMVNDTDSSEIEESLRDMILWNGHVSSISVESWEYQSSDLLESGVDGPDED